MTPPGGGDDDSGNTGGGNTGGEDTDIGNGNIPGDDNGAGNNAGGGNTGGSGSDDDTTVIPDDTDGVIYQRDEDYSIPLLIYMTGMGLGLGSSDGKETTRQVYPDDNSRNAGQSRGNGNPYRANIKVLK